MKRLWQASWPGRWLRTLGALARGVRIHPSATLLGEAAQFHLECGAIIGRGCVLRADGSGRVSLGEGVWLSRDVEVETETHVSIGSGTTVQRRCTVNGTTRVGAGCIFAPDVFISSGTHPFRHFAHLPIREQERRLAATGVSLDRPVWIQDDCWIGTHAVICPGVTLGKGSVVGANSVVTKDVPPFSVVAGSPARVIGQRLQWLPPARIEAGNEQDAPYVLSGTFAPTGIVPAKDEPLLIALRVASPGEVVRIRARSTVPSTIAVNGQRLELRAGEQELFVAGGNGNVFGATLRIEAPQGTVFTLFEIAQERTGP